MKQELKQTLLIMKGSKKATQNVLHRIAKAKKEYGADNADEYIEASKRVKNNS